MGAPSRVVAALAPPLKSTEARPSKNRLPDRVMVSKNVLNTREGSSLDEYDDLGSQGHAKYCPPLEPPQLRGISSYAHAQPLSKLLLDTFVSLLKEIHHFAPCLYGQRGLPTCGR